MSTKSSKAAEAFFKKQDKQAAMSEYQLRRQAEDEKSARLRVLRLAKEAADREEAAKAEAEKIAKAAKKPAPKRRKASAKTSTASA
ncbi:MAG: hypothetical protein ACTSX7_13355 [Alphaproteobacteria bacterium]